jgi:hypothetical protein
MVLNEADMRRIGLSLVGFDFDRQAKAGEELNAERFAAHYGCSPIVCANIWADLLVQGEITRPTKGFFIFLHFLKCYQKARQQEGLFKCCATSIRHDVWYFAKKVQALKNQKVRLPCHGNPSQRQNMY